MNQDAYNLKQAMREHAGGTGKYWRHPLHRRFVYTDGISTTAKLAKAYWLLDIVATEVVPTLLARLQDGWTHHFLKMVVDGNVATLKVDDDDTIIWVKHISYTDFPTGEWLFYLFADQVVEPGHDSIVMCLPEED